MKYWLYVSSYKTGDVAGLGSLNNDALKQKYLHAMIITDFSVLTDCIR
jgi:hypothetical protein